MVSIIIPAYNEEKRIKKTLFLMEKELLKEKIDFEILVVNDGSTDGTKEVVSAMENGHIRLLSYDKNKGKGAAVKHGVYFAAGEHIVFTDADLPYMPENIGKACKMLREDYDLVLGSRIKSQSGKSYPWYRTVLSKGFGALTNSVLHLKEKDTQCGFKAFRYDVAQEIFKRVSLAGWGFDVEIIFIAKKLGYKIGRLPVELFHENKISKIKVLKDAKKMAGEVFQIRKNNKEKKYE